jgi:uncharacterized protein
VIMSRHFCRLRPLHRYHRFLARLADGPRTLLILIVRAYRLLLSPWLGSACRFEPTCSRYAIEALEQHGAAAGSALTLARLARCHPWCEGGCDPVPAQPPRLFRGLSSTRSATTPLP